MAPATEHVHVYRSTGEEWADTRGDGEECHPESRGSQEAPENMVPNDRRKIKICGDGGYR